MARLLVLAFTFAIGAAAVPAGADEGGAARPPSRRPAHRPAVEQPAPAAAPQSTSPFGSMFRPYAHPGDGDDDVLSRDPDDCNKGCIGGEPG
jgi:hypothetical protein